MTKLKVETFEGMRARVKLRKLPNGTHVVTIPQKMGKQLPEGQRFCLSIAGVYKKYIILEPMEMEK